MSLNVFVRFPLPTIALAVSAALTGCGGGGGSSEQDSSAVEASVTSTAPVASTSSTTATTTTTSTTTSTSTDTSAASTTSTVPDTTTQQAGDSAVSTTTVASAGSSDTTTLAAGSAPSVVSATAARSGVGTNLNQVSYYSPEVPTIDLMKKASPWLTQCTSGSGSCTGFTGTARAWDTLEEAKLDVDANGWIKSLPATSSTASTFRYATSVVMSGNYQQTGKYVVRYDGSGTVTYGGAMSKSASESSSGRDVINVVNNGAAGWLTIQATDPTNYVRNIRIYPPGGVCANNMSVYAASATSCTSATGAYIAFENVPSTVVWHPQFLQDLKGYRSLRFMDWGQTNSTTVTSWTQRTSPTSYTWSGAAGVPVEAMFDLATAVGADPWINIPPYVDDDYVHQFAKLAHSKLAPQATMNLEYGNEMWNYAFPAAKWAYAQAQTLYAKQAAAGVNTWLLGTNWYAQRLVNVCQIVKTEFGADASRVKCVANTQAASPYNTTTTLDCTYAAAALGKSCAKFIDAVAIAPYFGYYVGSTASQPVIANWYSDADGGLSKLFQELTGLDASGNTVAALLAQVGSGAPTGAINQASSWMVGTKAALSSYGLPMLAYEGGEHLVPGSDPKLLTLMTAANRDARMGTAYQQMLQDWRAAGGQTFMFFTDVKTVGTSGMWGLKENQFDAAAPKWKTATQWRTSACWWTGC